MAGFNRVILIGNLTRDPEYKQLSSGQGVCKLGLATNRQFKNRQSGTMTQEVCYIDIDVWGAQAESCRQFLKKGKPVLIEGRLKYDEWKDPQGQSRNKHSIVADRVVFLGSSTHDEAASADSFEAEPNNFSSPSRSTNRPGAAVRADSSMPEPQNELERELFGQIDQIKSRKQKSTNKKSAEGTIATGEVDFKDQPPFEDDLPF